MLGVSSAMANRAMTILAENHLLIRHRSRGTFVGPGYYSDAKTAVHLIKMTGGSDISGIQAEQMMSALRTVTPDARLDCHFYPKNNSAWQIHRDVEKMAADKSFGGLVLYSCSRDVQEDVARAGVPAVLWGSAYPGVDLPYIDFDQAEIGRLMAKQAVEAGYRRLHFVTRETWREGDTLTFNGITDHAAKADLGHGAVKLQNVPETADELVMQNVLERMIRDVADVSPESVAFLCRSSSIAKQLYLVSQSCSAWISQRMTIVFDASWGDDQQTPPGMFVRSKMPFEEAFSIVGRMLSEIMSPDSKSPASVKLPVLCGQNNNKPTTKPL